jgi:O-6-methylguanine DNA methyltransferase
LKPRGYPRGFLEIPRIRMRSTGNALNVHFHFSTLSHDITGPLTIYHSPAGLAAISFAPGEKASNNHSSGVDGTGIRLTPGNSSGEVYKEQLLEYLEGRRESFDFQLDCSLLKTPFQRSVLGATRALPFGRLKSYKEIAISIGKPGASRAVGNALGSNPLPIVIPCHRVIASGNRLGGFMRNAKGGREIKRRLLVLEGHEDWMNPVV